MYNMMRELFYEGRITERHLMNAVEKGFLTEAEVQRIREEKALYDKAYKGG